MSSKPTNTSPGSTVHSWVALILGCAISAAPYFVPVINELVKQYPLLGVVMPIGAVIWNNYVKPIASK